MSSTPVLRPRTRRLAAAPQRRSCRNRDGPHAFPRCRSFGGVGRVGAGAEQAAASHTQTTFLGALYRRWIKRLPKKKAMTRLAHRILLIIYQVMTIGQPYRELGPRYHDEWDRSQILTRTVRRLERLGYRVTSSRGIPLATRPKPHPGGSRPPAPNGIRGVLSER